MQFATGSYIGNNTDDRWINDPGFQPDLVLIKGDTTQYAVWRSSTMDAGECAYFSLNLANFTNGIQAFGANGFQVGTHATVNSNLVVYYWVAIKDTGGDDFQVGSYTGDGTDSRNITGVGFQPTCVWVKGDYTQYGAWRNDSHSGDDASLFNAVANIPNLIQSFIADGFQIGDDLRVNANTYTYYYAAFRDSELIEMGAYEGDGTDDRSIAVGFQPDFVFVKGDTTENAWLRIDTMDAGDSSPFSNVTPTGNRIQAFEVGGFQVGSAAQVNTAYVDYYWAAFKSGTSTTTTTVAPTTTTVAPTTTTLPPASGTYYFVDATGGNDANTGLSPAQAWQTLTKVFDEFAVGTFVGGDCILFKRGETWIAAGTARLRIRNVAGTTLATPLRIGAYGSGVLPILNGNLAMGSPILTANSSIDGAVNYVIAENLDITGALAQQVYIYGCKGWWLNGLTVGRVGASGGLALQIRYSEWVHVFNCDLTSSGAPSGNPEVVYIGVADGSDNPKHIYIASCYIHDGGYELIDLKPGAEHVVIENNILSNATNECVSLRGSHHIVRDNVISNTGSYGIVAWLPDSQNLRIENNLIKDVAGQGILLYGSGHTIRGNAIANCTAEAIRLNASSMKLRNNILYKCTTGIRVASGYPIPDSDYNCFYDLTNHLYLADFGGYQTAAQACAAHGIECNSIAQNPNFVDEVDYEITDGSPCYEAGEEE